jgi:O-antigen/teichoic acid export membrane protein
MSSLVKISFWLSLSELAFNISGYIIHASMGRILDPAGYGRFSLIITFTTMIIVLIGRGVPISTSKYLSEITEDKANKYNDIKRSALFLQTSIILIVSSVYFLSAPVFANLLNDPTLTNLFRISSLIIPAFALSSLYAYYFNGIKDFKKVAFLKFWRAILKIIFIIGLGFLYKIKGAIIGQALAPFVVFLTAWFIDPFKKSKIKNQPNFKNNPLNKKLAKKLATFAGPIVIFMLFHELMLSMNLYMVKAILQQDDLTGIYSAASTVSRIPYYLFFFMTIILLPKISELIANKKLAETQSLLQKAFKYLFLTLLPITFLLSLFSKSAVTFFYGDQYSLAGPIMSILIFGFAFLTVFYIITFVLNGAGKNKFPVLASITGTFLNAIVSFFLIKKFGLIGSAFGITITAFIIMIWTLFYSNRNIVKFLNLFSILKYLLASILIYFLGLNFFDQGRYTFFLWSFILILLYLVLMIITKEIGIRDWNYLKKSLKK